MPLARFAEIAEEIACGCAASSAFCCVQRRTPKLRFPVQVAGLDAYEAMPVEAFGEAMLRGMGWQEGKSVGKNAKQVRPADKHLHINSMSSSEPAMSYIID